MKLRIYADGFEGFSKRAVARARKLDASEKLKAEVSITFESALEMLQVLTPQRIRLIEMTRTQPHTVSGLATALGRDPKAVRRDIAKLESVGVLRTRQEINPGHGRVKIVEPAAANVELRASF
jgi:predicted transcriptional regulator